MTILERPAEPAAQPVRAPRLAATADRYVWLLPALVGIVAFAVRVPAMRQGLPYIWHPDSRPTSSSARTWCSSAGCRRPTPIRASCSTSSPGSSGSGSTSSASLARARRCRLVRHRVPFPNPSGTGSCGRSAWVGFRSDPARWCASASRRTTRRTGVAIFVAALLVLSPLLVTNGVFVTPDIYAGAFTAAVLVGALWVLRRGTWPAYVCNAPSPGWPRRRSTTPRWSWSLRCWRTWSGTAAPCCAAWSRCGGCWRWWAPRWLCSSRQRLLALVEPSKVWNGIEQERHHYGSGHPGMTGSSIDAYLHQLVHC